MNLIEIINFLIPSDFFQWIFLGIILLLAGTNIFFVKKKAIPTTWENNWHGHTSNDTSDDLDADHGSLGDLSQAVASTWEKLAEIMPGILLVIGLLGTFLGLGIALNKASDILQHTQSSGMDMGQAVNSLMGMMEGLGSKFKTSTWGIIGFLAFKAWATKNSFDERRLRWCVQKMKKQIDNEREIENEEKKAKAAIEEQRGQKTVDAIEKLCSAIGHEISSNRNVLEQNQKLLAAKLAESKRFTAVMAELDKKSELQNSLSTTISEKMNNVNESIKTFIDSNNANLDAMGDASKNMASAAQQMGSSADNLKNTVVGFKTEISSVLNKLEDNLKTTITAMSKNLEGATNGISTAVNTMSDQVKETMQGIGKDTRAATEMQKKAFVEFNTISRTLNENVQGMTNLVEKLQEDILLGLNAVSDKRLQTVQAMSAISNISEKLVHTSEKLEKLPENINIANVNTQKMIDQLEALRILVSAIADSVNVTQNETIHE